MTDGTPSPKPNPVTSTSHHSIPAPTTNAHASRHHELSSPHASNLLLHASQAAAVAGLLNQQNAASNANIDFSFPPLDTSVAVFGSTTPVRDRNNNSSNNNGDDDSGDNSSSGTIQFRSQTIAPSPPAESPTLPSSSAPGVPRRSDRNTHDDVASPCYQPSPLSLITSPSSIVTAPADDRRDGTANLAPATPTRPSASALSGALQRKASSSSLKPVSRTPSFKNTPLVSGLGHGFGTASAASSTYPSPIISAMGDVTPLPSPLLSSHSPGPWRRLGGRPGSRDGLSPDPRSAPSESVIVSSAGESISAALAHQNKRKAYSGLALELQEGAASDSSARKSASTAGSGQEYFLDAHSNKLQQPQQAAVPHTRNRSVSEYIPDPMLLPKRMVTVTGSRGSKSGDNETLQLEMQQKQMQMRREPHLSAARGLTAVEKPPTPPPSESSLSAADLSSSSSASVSGPTTAATTVSKVQKLPTTARYEYFEALCRSDGKMRRWRAIKLLGQGTFSRVMLATSSPPAAEAEGANGVDGTAEEESRPSPHHSNIGRQYDRKSLVAVKVCEHGPKGGASEDRVEMSLKRELEIMQSIRHPSLVHLRAWSIEPTRAILVLSYCPGGDLFDVATAHRQVLTPGLMRRIFAELVAAVQYLHERHIVHRDIKLENVLVNIPPWELAKSTVDWATYPYPVSTLTDLGLSRRVADDEKLETRCGSDDYAAPEVIMGQPYDGRAVDGWSLGVLLYALLESRLPFDPMPGTVAAGGNDYHRMRSRTSHRIARIEWRWVAFAGDDGDHEGDEALFRAKGLLGAMHITEGLLRRARSRWPLSKVAEDQWVRDAICVEGGIRFREEDEGEGVEGR